MAWIPQAFAQFLQTHDALMQAHVRAALGDKMPSPAARLMRRPADGTAHAASIVGVERTNVPGLTLLHLVASTALDKPRNGAESAIESGFDSVVSDDNDGARTDAALRRPPLYKSGARRRAGHGDVAPALARLRRERAAVARPRGDGVARGHPARSQRALPPRRLARGRLRGPGRGLRRLGGDFISAVARRAAPLARGARPPARPCATDAPEARPQV